jgi:hypothetical protein
MLVHSARAGGIGVVAECEHFGLDPGDAVSDENAIDKLTGFLVPACSTHRDITRADEHNRLAGNRELLGGRAGRNRRRRLVARTACDQADE